MLTISNPLSASQAQAYHAEEFGNARDNYYTEGDRISGEWHGRLAEQWGLRGSVSEEHFQRLSEGLHPITGEQLPGRVDVDLRRLEVGVTRPRLQCRARSAGEPSLREVRHPQVVSRPIELAAARPGERLPGRRGVRCGFSGWPVRGWPTPARRRPGTATAPDAGTAHRRRPRRAGRPLARV